MRRDVSAILRVACCGFLLSTGVQTALAEEPVTTATEPAVAAPATAAATAPAPVKPAAPAYGPDNEGPGWAARLYYGVGGDDVVYVLYTDGSSDTISAGDGLGFALGGHYRPAGSRFDMSLLVGLKIAQITDGKASVEVNRTTIDVGGDYYLSKNFWAGAALTLHRGISADLDKFGPGIDFDDARGFTYRLGWKCVAISHTDMDYKDEFGITYDASNTSLELVGRF